MPNQDLEQASGSSADSIELAKVQSATGDLEPGNTAATRAAGAASLGTCLAHLRQHLVQTQLSQNKFCGTLPPFTFAMCFFPC